MRRLPFLFFFLSGASSLVLEVAWVRQFSLVLGNTVLSTTAVLAAFMGGLALGSFLAGRMADRIQRPIRLYGMIEGGIGIYALLLPLLILISQPLLRLVYDGLIDQQVVLTSLRFLIALVLLIVPTTLMGATLPLLSQAMTRRNDEAGSVSGQLYAANLIGAATGSFLGGFALLPYLGLTLTVILAALINFGIAGTVWTYFRDTRGPEQKPTTGKAGKKLARTAPSSPAPTASPSGAPTGSPSASSSASPTSKPAPVPAATPLSRAGWIAILIFALSGAASMIYQVTWVRLLSLIFGSSVYSFSLTVTVFIVGLGIGDWVFSWRRIKTRDGLWLLSGIMAAVALASLATLPLVQQLPEKTFQTVRAGASYGGLLRLQVGWTFVMLLLPTFFIGAVFPVVIRTLSKGGGSAGRVVGLAYSWNTIGAILGTLVGGLLLIPRLGIQESLVVAVCLSFVSAVIGALFSKQRAVLRYAAAVATAAAAVMVWLIPPPLNAMTLSSGPYHPATGNLIGDHTTYRNFIQGSTMDLVFHEEGMAATVSVRSDRKGSLALVIGGKTDASISEDGGDLPTQIMLSALPLLLKGDARDLLVVGLASGMSVGSAEAFPLETIDCVEISPEVVRACREHFSVYNGQALDDERVRLILTDARHHITMTRKQYDVIVSEPSNPWIAGINALFTRDFFTTARGRLKPGGLFCQWFHAYDMSEQGVKVILRTFAAVFPHVTLWESMSGDHFLVGSDAPIPLDPKKLERLVQGNPRLAQWLRLAGIGEIRGLFGNLMTGEEALRAVVGDGPVNTDNNGFLEYHAPYYMYTHSRPPLTFFSSLRLPDPAALYQNLDPPLQRLVQDAAKARLFAYKGQHETQTNRILEGEGTMETAFNLNPADPLIRTQRTRLLIARAQRQFQNRDPRGALASYTRILDAPPLHAEAFYVGQVYNGRATAHNMMDQMPQALVELDTAQRYTPRSGPMWLLRGIVLYRMEQPEEALAALATAEEHGARDIELFLARAVIHHEAGRLDQARQSLRAAEIFFPGDPRIDPIRTQIATP